MANGAKKGKKTSRVPRVILSGFGKKSGGKIGLSKVR